MLLSWYGDHPRYFSEPRSTFGTRQYCAIPFLASGLCVSRQAHPDVGRRRVVQHDQATVANHGSHHHPLETALPGTWARWIGHLSSGNEGHGADAGTACPDFVRQPEEAERRVDPLELPQ